MTCDDGYGGTCSTPCSVPGISCGDGGTCVEYPIANACRTPCSTNDDCRADEGYACDPVWKGCVLANAPTIAALSCPPPIGFGRDPSFAPPTLLGVGREPAAAIADDGSIAAVHASGETQNIIRLDHKNQPENAKGLLAGDAAIARDGSQLFVATGNARGVLLSTSSDRGRTWAPPITIADRECGASNCAPPVIAAGNDPQRKRILYVAYPAEGGLRVRASRDHGASFGPPITAVPGARGSLAIAGDGTLYVVALRGSPLGSYGSGDQEILLARSVDGGRSFGKPTLISRYGERIPYYFGTPRVEVDSTRKWIYIAYTRGGRDGNWDLALVAIKDLNKPWIRTRIGDDATCKATYLAPQLALDPTTGALHLAWYDSRGPRYAHGVCTEGLRFCRQLGRIDDGFTGLSLARHGTAASESTSLLVDNQRRLLHAVWSQPVGAESRIFHAKAKLPLR